MLDSIDERILVHFLFRNKKQFIAQARGKLDAEAIDYAVKLWFTPLKKKRDSEERAARKERILRQVRRLNSHYGTHKSSIKLKDETMSLIDTLVKESGFTKNRKKKLRVFLVEMATWRKYIKSLNYDHLRTLEAIFFDFSANVMKGLTPLPASLLGRWVSGDIPARKPVDRFMKDILDKITDEEIRKVFMDSYYLDRTGRRYVLKKSISEEDIVRMKKALDSIGYINRSGTKFIDFLKFLREKGVISLEARYSTHGKCNYYKINL